MGTIAGSSMPAFPDGPHRGRISVRPPARRVARGGARRAPASAGWRRSASAPCTSRPTPRRRSPRRGRRRRPHGGWLLREAGAPGLDGFGDALPNAGLQARISAAFDPDGQVLAGAARLTCRSCSSTTRLSPRGRAASCPSTKTSSWRASRAGCASRTARRTASPGSSRRHPAAGSRRCAKSSSRARPIDAAFVASMETCVQCRGCEAACPSTVPFGHLMEGTRAALARTGPSELRPWWRRVAEWVAYRGGAASSPPAPRAHVAHARRAAPAPRSASLRAAEAVGAFAPRAARRRAVAATRRVLFPGCVMDAWQRDVHRAALTVMRAAGARPTLPGRGADCCGALHAHAGRDLGGAPPRAARDRVDARRRADRRRQRGLRRGHEGLRPAARHTGSRRVLGTGARLLGVARRASRRSRSVTPARVAVVQDPCHLRHVQHAQGFVRTVLGPAYATARDRRRRPVLRRRRRVRGAATRRSRATSGTRKVAGHPPRGCEHA